MLVAQTYFENTLAADYKLNFYETTSKIGAVIFGVRGKPFEACPRAGRGPSFITTALPFWRNLHTITDGRASLS